MKNMLPTLPTNRAATDEELNNEAREWGFATWEEFCAELDRQVEERAEELDELETFYDYSEVISNVPARKT
jgi:hypothetical protein